MVQFNYDRRYELSITKTKNLFGDQNELFKTVPIEDTFGIQNINDWRVVDQTTLTFTDIHFEADISSSNTTDGTKGKNVLFKLYNLSDESKNFVQEKNNNVLLKAGYNFQGEELPMLFVGQIKDYWTKKQGQDVITFIMCGDGHVAKNSVRISANVPAGFTYSDVFNKLAETWNSNGVATGKLVLDQSPTLAPVLETPPSQTYLTKGWSFSGSLRKAMDDVCQSFNYTWQIVNNRLFVHPKYYKDMIGVVVLDENNIISIEDSEESVSTHSNENKKSGLKIKVLLDGRITDEKRIKIESGSKSGEYAIRNVSHSLSYEGQNWYTTVGCDKGE